MSNYCTYTDVGILIKSTTFTDATTPTIANVTDIITQITGEIDSVLAAVGIMSQPTDTNTLAMLKKYCSFGSAGIVGISFFRNADNVDNTNADWYYKEYKEFLDKIIKNPEIIGAGGSGTSIYMSSDYESGANSVSKISDRFVSEDFKY